MRFADDVRRLVPLAWPVFVGQIAVMLFSTVDTLMLGQVSAQDLAALAVGSAAYVTVFVGLMGVVLAVAPLAGRHFGAGEHTAAGHSYVQAQWLGLLLCVPGCLLLWWPEPFIWLAELNAISSPLLRSLRYSSIIFTLRTRH
jgi:MATE family multidrug resistance protein